MILTNNFFKNLSKSLSKRYKRAIKTGHKDLHKNVFKSAYKSVHKSVYKSICKSVCNKGIGLLDILIAIALTGIITTLLYQSLDQTSRNVRLLDRVVDVNVQLGVFSSRISEELAGLFVPQKYAKAYRKIGQDAEGDINNKTESSKQSGAERGSKNLTGKPECEGGDCKLFFLRNMKVDPGGGFPEDSVLTFITSNPLHVYEEESPRKVRVGYFLLPEDQEGQNARLFKLSRFESEKVDYEKFKELRDQGEIRKYDLLNNISEFEINCVKDYSQDSQDSTNSKLDEDIKYIDSFSDFELAKKKEKFIPVLVEIKGVLKRGKDFRFLFPVYFRAGSLQGSDESKLPENPTGKPAEARAS